MKKQILGALAGLLIAGAAQASGLGLRGMEHIGVTVPSIAEGKAFFEKVLGCEQAYALGPFKDEKGTWMTDNIGAHKSSVANIASLKCGNSTNIELFEFTSPSQNKASPKRDDVGAVSIGFYVDDINAAVAHLKKNNVKLLGDIKKVEEGPIAGRSWIYAETPWGLQIFFESDPNGIAYTKTPGAVKLFSPRNLPN
ncbi:catechol 2,3-dioxygenase-like lactoylglutathione lyase family enzyme [Microvirga flocculans]|uniref:Catechol 2,3-dioxygenase-like lactoylglutathione lyase family enzyme n=1 Tax=Microvirga flocculans TaxID=217168 RepID=A0A7W6ICG8_9HYPH|nr:VOC family protein [Microvirga flocculans]MBB4038918.1 catechol 2,3-dioxygenase-like lactoylglutathione lyase family enzyme [Microvirga flocculans]